MPKMKWWGKTLRVLGIILMRITSAFPLMAGIGTTFVAVTAKNFGPKMAVIHRIAGCIFFSLSSQPPSECTW